MKYIVELSTPKGAKAYFTPGRGFHGDKKFAESFPENDSENKLAQVRKYLDDNWHLNSHWTHWGGCSKEHITIKAVLA